MNYRYYKRPANINELMKPLSQKANNFRNVWGAVINVQKENPYLCSSFTLTAPIPAFAGTYNQVKENMTPVIGFFSGASSPFTFVCGTAPNGKDYAVFAGGLSGNTLAYFSNSDTIRTIRTSEGVVTSFADCGQTFTQVSNLNIISAYSTEFNGLQYPNSLSASYVFTYENCPVY